MKRIISQISIILLILLVGTPFSAVNKVFAATTIKCVSSVYAGDNFTVSLNGIRAETVGYNCDIKVTYKDGSTENGKLAYLGAAGDALGGNKTSWTFKSNIVGTAKVEILNLTINKNGGETVTESVAAMNVEIMEKQKPCTHETKKTEVVQALSCTKDKIEVTKCSKCGKELERKTTEKAKGHTKGDAQVTKEATCCENGKKVVKCTVCNAEIENTTITATGNHTYSSPCKKTKPANNTTNKNNTSNTSNTTNTAKNTTNTNKVDDEVKMPTFKEVDEKVYAKKSCNVRSSCSTKTNNNKIGSLSEGEQLTRTGISSEWSRVIFNGKTAYVATDLLTTEEPVEETNEVANENVDDEMAAIQRQVGVLPEVGTNVATTMYFVITLLAVAGVSGSLYYINKK